MQGVSAQTELSWEDFADIDFEPAYNEFYEEYFPFLQERLQQFASLKSHHKSF